MYDVYGGVTTLRIFSSVAAVTALLYLILHQVYLKHVTPGKIRICFNGYSTDRSKFLNVILIADTRRNVEWRTPEEANAECVTVDS